MIQLTKMMVSGIMLGASCAQPVNDHHHTITIPERYEWTFNAQGGDQINQIMDPITINGMTPQARCEDQGGKFRVDDYSTLMICDDIDF